MRPSTRSSAGIIPLPWVQSRRWCSGVDEARVAPRVEAAEESVELRQQPDSRDLTGRRSAGQVVVAAAVGPGPRRSARRRAVERGIHDAQPDAGPPGDVVAAGRAVGREWRRTSASIAPSGSASTAARSPSTRGGGAVAGRALGLPAALERTPHQAAVAEAEVAARLVVEPRPGVRVVRQEPGVEVVAQLGGGAPVVAGEVLDAGPDVLERGAVELEGALPQGPLAEPGRDLEQRVVLAEWRCARCRGCCCRGRSGARRTPPRWSPA